MIVCRIIIPKYLIQTKSTKNNYTVNKMKKKTLSKTNGQKNSQNQNFWKVNAKKKIILSTWAA